MKRIVTVLIFCFLLIAIGGCDTNVNHSKSSNALITTPSTTPTTQSLPTVDENKESMNDNWTYYTNNDDTYKLYKKNSDGSKNIKFCDDERVHSFVVSDDWVYYTFLDDGIYSLYKVKTDGSMRQKVCEVDFLGNPSSNLVNSKIEGDWIIFDVLPSQQAGLTEEEKRQDDERVKNGTHTYRVSLDGKKYELIK